MCNEHEQPSTTTTGDGKPTTTTTGKATARSGPGMGTNSGADIEKAQQALQRYREQQRRDGNPDVRFGFILDDEVILAALAGVRLAFQGMGKALQMAARALVKAIKEQEVERQKLPAMRWIGSPAFSQPLSARIALPYETLRHSYGRQSPRRR